MFGLSFPELVVVMIVALIVLGPERLPKLAKTIGKTMRDVRRTTAEFKDMVEGEFHAIEQTVEGQPERKGGVPEGVAALPAGSHSGPTHAAPAGAPALRPAGAVPAAETAVHRVEDSGPVDATATHAPVPDATADASAPTAVGTATAAETAVHHVEDSGPVDATATHAPMPAATADAGAPTPDGATPASRTSVPASVDASSPTADGTELASRAGAPASDAGARAADGGAAAGPASSPKDA